MAVPSAAPGTQPPKYTPQGYHRLARIMTRDKTLAMFRRFDDVLLITLMRLQAEIMDLRTRFLIQVELDQQSDSDPEKLYSYSFAKLRASKESNSEQLDLLDRMGTKIKEYYDLLLQASQLATLRHPSKHDLHQLQKWLSNPLGGHLFQSGSELRIWHDSEDPDFGETMFASLAPDVGENDAFTNAITEFVANSFHHRFGERWKLATLLDEESGLRSYNDSEINRATSIVTTVLSSILPVITILVLYRINSAYGRIGATVGFTAIFAAVLAYFTKARRIEVLAATATFAAVEVIFIGSAIGHSDG